MSTPRLSIAVPIYNGAKYMRRALDSVLTQSFRDFELIISDNASTDATPEISAEYARNDPRVRVVRRDQTMIAYLHFREVYREAAGAYFMWLAADDWWREGFLGQAVALLDSDPGIALVFSHMEVYNWATDRFGPRRYVTSSFNGRKTRLMTRILNSNPHMMYGMFRRSMLQPDEIPVMDFTEIYVPDLLAIRGDVAVVNDHLFVAGETVAVRRTYSVFGGYRLHYLQYWRTTCRMIRQNFRGPTRWLFIAAATGRMWRWIRHLK